MQSFESSKERIKKMFEKIELSVSSYDTAWLAMVPSPDSPQDTCFPECMIWLMENQLHEGSWGLPDQPSWLVKDALSCTLASVLALNRWGIGEENLNKDIKSIESKLSSAIDVKQHTPIGFDIIFLGMIEYVKDLNLNFSLRSNDMDTMLQRRQSELRRCYLEGRIEYLAYVSEGIGKLQDWEMVMKYQRKNGSLFNSPSTTAAALTHHLQNASFYPFEIYVRLTMVDIVESLGIDRHFRKEIKRVLDETYRTADNNVKGKHRCWLLGAEERFLDITTCAMTFRMLRAHGYDVSADERIYPEELVLEKQKLWTSQFLKQELSKDSFHSDRVSKYVNRQKALEFMYHANLERLAHKRNIKHYGQDDIRILKTSFRWVVEKRLDKLNYARQKIAYCYFSVTATLIFPELSDASMYFVRLGTEQFHGKDVTRLFCKLSEEVVRSPEFCNLFKRMGTCGRLLNDIQTFKRESKEGKLNAVSMQMSHSVTAEEVIEKIRARIDNERRELLGLVWQENGSIVPRACKDLFWNMSKLVHLFYMKEDGFTKHDMLNAVNEVIHEPISVDELG
ncbi:hypothetical protein Ddye_014284 [Dipteronia dyeriana]|uniref:Terpene synthase N-terminal domain-containing protein n=1 Tax=Dipteronia dyeriana TaxID=168575 RepID=A0AAD9X8J5_9ROSI|nr:hypothetical protein Ddye_014284 [Dipteronia dyeriana]